VGEDERALRGVLVGKDEATDLALVKVEGGPFPVLGLGDSEGLEVGEWVVAIGNPFGLSRSVTTGIVSYKGRRDVKPLRPARLYDFIQTDAAINPGNSGGPLLDAHGAVVGINAAVNPAGQGIGFAIPIHMLKEIAPQLEKGHVVRSWMGMSVQDQLGPDLAEWFGVPGGKGVVITDVMEGGRRRAPGCARATWWSPSKETTSARATACAGSLRTRAWPDGADGRLARAQAAYRGGGAGEKPGETAVERPVRVAAGRKDQEPFGLSVEEQPGRPGLRVSSVDLRSTAYRAGLREGDVVVDVDGQPVHDRAAFRRAVAGGGAVTRLYVKRNGRSIFFGLRRDPAGNGRSPLALTAFP